MSLQRNQPNQNFTFAMISAATDQALTNALGIIVGYAVQDGGNQASLAGTLTELGHGVYNYEPTQGETNGNCLGFLMTTGTTNQGIPENLMFLTGGLHKTGTGQVISFGMITISGQADGTCSPVVYVSKDGGSQTSGGGVVTNVGNGQFNYHMTNTEVNGTAVTYTFTAPNDIPINICVFTVNP